MKNINYLLILLLSNYCLAQVKLFSNDTLHTKFYNYKSKLIKSFIYKKQYVTSQTGNELFVLYDSICDLVNQKQKLIYSEDYSRKYFYYKDSLIIRNWDMHDTSIKYKNYFELSLYLKSKKYENLIISIYYNRNDSLCSRLYISKPDSLSFYTDKIYFDNNFKDTQLTDYQSYKLNNNSNIYFYVNKKNSIDKLYYDFGNNKTLFISFSGFFIPKEYGFRDSRNNTRIGEWYNYDEKGKLKSQGKYSSSNFDNKGNEININKTGEWIYYTKEGCIDKVENWKNGMLNTEETQKRQKKK